MLHVLELLMQQLDVPEELEVCHVEHYKPLQLGEGSVEHGRHIEQVCPVLVTSKLGIPLQGANKCGAQTVEQ